MARDALALADELELDSFHLLGISMGGAIAQEIALQAPEPRPHPHARRDLPRQRRLRATGWPRCGATRVRQISREQHVDELMLMNHSEAFFETRRWSSSSGPRC